VKRLAALEQSERSPFDRGFCGREHTAVLRERERTLAGVRTLRRDAAASRASHRKRVAYNRYKVTIAGSVPVQSASGKTKLQHTADG
jgi:hypothetical protein